MDSGAGAGSCTTLGGSGSGSGSGTGTDGDSDAGDIAIDDDNDDEEPTRSVLSLGLGDKCCVVLVPASLSSSSSSSLLINLLLLLCTSPKREMARAAPIALRHRARGSKFSRRPERSCCCCSAVLVNQACASASEAVSRFVGSGFSRAWMNPFAVVLCLFVVSLKARVAESTHLRQKRCSSTGRGR